MMELPESLKSRFTLYLNILPAVEATARWALLLGGIVSLLIAVTKVSLQLSQHFQPSHKISKQRKYASIYQDTIQRIDDGEKVYELNEKMPLPTADMIFEIDLNSESKYMLDDEPAISDDDEEIVIDRIDDVDGDSINRCSSHFDDSNASTKVSINFLNFRIDPNLFDSLDASNLFTSTDKSIGLMGETQI